jgi:hypothetical protein
MKLTGGSLKINELMEILKASYLESPPKTIYNYTLDEKLSNLYGKVYVDTNKKKVVIAFRGTKETSDWANNLIYASSSAYKLTPRYKTAKKMYDNALKKYKNFQFESIGHSQGSLLARLLSDKSINSIQLNPAYKAETLKDNEYIIRSSADAVSALTVPKKMINSVLYPSWTKEHMITIPAETNNPITEHKIDILNRLDQNKKIGRGGCKFEGGAKNQWFTHVKNYAKEKNISYACAISEASKTYKKIDKKEKEEQFRREQIILWNKAINRFMKRYDDDNDSLPLIQVNFNNRPKSFQEHLKKVSLN